MARPLVLAFLGISLVAGCTVGDSGGGGGGGAPDASIVGDSGGGDDAQVATPRVDVSIDKPTIDTELNTATMLTVTIQTSGGFSGPVNLAASVVDDTNAPLTEWTVVLNQTTVNVAADGTQTVVATLTIPSENSGLAGTVKIDATSSAGTVNLTSAVTALNQVTLPVTFSGTNCQYPGNVSVRVGTKVRWLNKGGATNTLIVHTNGAGGLMHGTNTPIPQNQAYEQTASSAATVPWYCHSPGPDLNGANPKVTIVP